MPLLHIIMRLGASVALCWWDEAKISRAHTPGLLLSYRADQHFESTPGSAAAQKYCRDEASLLQGVVVCHVAVV